MKLSRLIITGNISINTPMCVLIEIADAHGINYDFIDEDTKKREDFSYHLVKTINKTNTPIIDNLQDYFQRNSLDNHQDFPMNSLIKQTDLPFIARFINKHISWNQQKLREAYNFILFFMDINKSIKFLLNKIPKNFTFGLQTQDNIFSINACILYKICIYHRLNINYKTTIDQMANGVRLLQEDILSIIEKSKIFIDRDAKRSDLINILMLSQNEIIINKNVLKTHEYDSIPDPETNYEALKLAYVGLTDISYLRSKMNPTTINGVIALAALNFGIDISRSAVPMKEYDILKISGKNEYCPNDIWMKFWYNYNPKIFDLSITFNPLFPVGFYEKIVLIDMAKNEGYTDKEISSDNPYELLQLAYISETFYQGLIPGMKDKETSVNLEIVNEIDIGQLLCYGQLNTLTKPISIEELFDSFENNRNFNSPFASNSTFSKISINKLKIILQNPNINIRGADIGIGIHMNPNNLLMSNETIQMRQRLLEKIIDIEMLSRNNDEASINLYTVYRNSDPDTKQEIKNAIVSLLHIGMYMRGWKGKEEFPLKEAPVSKDETPIIALNVTSAISRYESIARSLGKIGKIINNLPLVKYHGNEYQVSNSERDGYTIEDRLDIVKQGNKSGNIKSCIRLTSNWICASAHKYIMALGFPSPFDIFNLRYIS